MAILSAENSFKNGLLAIVDDNYEAAARHFRRAIEIQEQRAFDRPDWRYLSYYGLSIAKAHRPDDLAIESCRRAAEQGILNADLFLNLGRVYRLAGKHPQATEAIRHGLKLEPGHGPLQEELRLLESTAPSRVGRGQARETRPMRWSA